MIVPPDIVICPKPSVPVVPMLIVPPSMVVPPV